MITSNLTWGKANQLISANTEEVSSVDFVAAPLVSVCFLTYNHVSFIEKALDGVLMQDVNFAFEVIIGDDASTDGSSEIIDRYQRKHLEKIKILRSTENLGVYTGSGRLNLLRNLSACRGGYITILEGDDYWTDPFKLQKQIEYLKRHPDCAGSCHDVTIVDGAGSKRSLPDIFVDYEDKVDLNFNDMVSSKTPFHTSSFVFRREVIECLPSWFLNAPYGDRPLFFLAAEIGRIRRIPEVMGAYRKHEDGRSLGHFGIKYTMNFLRFNYILKRYFAPQGAAEFDEMLRLREKNIIGCVAGSSCFKEYVTVTAFFTRHLRFRALSIIHLRLLRARYLQVRHLIGKFIPRKFRGMFTR
ncbi:glycosyltransferase [Akkermansiaceae bacterium]|nr:glycosyltransferase [Akkermansiaceae bacterium]